MALHGSKTPDTHTEIQKNGTVQTVCMRKFYKTPDSQRQMLQQHHDIALWTNGCIALSKSQIQPHLVFRKWISLSYEHVLPKYRELKPERKHEQNGVFFLLLLKCYFLAWTCDRNRRAFGQELQPSGLWLFTTLQAGLNTTCLSAILSVVCYYIKLSASHECCSCLSLCICSTVFWEMVNLKVLCVTFMNILIINNSYLINVFHQWRQYHAKQK